MKIPDSIEPVIGWRAFHVSKNGHLHSPTFAVSWPPGGKLTARCVYGHHDTGFYEWRVVRASSTSWLNQENDAEMTYGKHVRGFGGPPAPLPDGYDWQLVYYKPPHGKPPEAPVEGCNCGIHLARSKATAWSYADDQPIFVVGKVAGWGKVLVGKLGWRVQYAYPTELWLFGGYPKTRAAMINTLSENYQVPVHEGVLDDPKHGHPKASRSHRATRGLLYLNVFAILLNLGIALTLNSLLNVVATILLVIPFTSLLLASTRP